MKSSELNIYSLESDEDKSNYNTLLHLINGENPFFSIALLTIAIESADALKYAILSIDGIPKAVMTFYLREIKIKNNTETWYDAISPYGYSGPLFHPEIIDEEITIFWKLMDGWYKKNNVISEFIRFGLQNNHINYSGTVIHTLANVKGKIIDEETQWKNFKPKVRNNYRKANLSGLKSAIFHKNISEEQIKEFYAIYISTMVRNEAVDQYYYSYEYFKNFIEENPNQCALVLISKESITISTELILLHQDTMYSFLGGTNSDYFGDRPNDFLKIEALNWGRLLGYKWYVLGGGRRDNDGLYQYKKSFFSKDQDITYFTGRKIIHPEKYHKLVSYVFNNGVADSSLIHLDGYFPKYRELIPKQSIEVKIIEEKQVWDAVIGEIENFDFYHTFDYHHLSKKTNERPVLLKYCIDEQIMALPLFIRPIANTNYFDATSAYGYVGPIHKTKLTQTHIESYQKALVIFFKEEKIISVFSRLNPYIENQNTLLEGLGSITSLGPVVNIDLTLSLEEQRANYSKSTKSRVNKARKSCFTKLVSSTEDLNAFIDIYYENMTRLNATKDYFFSRDYFFEFFNSKNFKTDVLLVFDNETNEPIAGSMFVKTNNIVQFHLSGTKNEYLNIAPARVFIDEMRVKATEDGFTYFNLGGGLGSQQDSLYEFKSSFSKDHKTFKVWKYIVDEKVYEELTKKTLGVDFNSPPPQYFPLYRYEVTTKTK